MLQIMYFEESILPSDFIINHSTGQQRKLQASSNMMICYLCKIWTRDLVAIPFTSSTSLVAGFISRLTQHLTGAR